MARSITATLAAVDKYGGKVDKAARTAIEAGIAHADRAATWQPDGAAPAAAIYAAVVADRDPLADPAVAAALLAQQVEATRPAVVHQAAAALAELVHDHLDAIVAGLAAAYDVTVARPLADVHAALAPLGLRHDSDPGVVLRAGPAASAAAAGIATAVAAHARLVGIYGSLRVDANIMAGSDLALIWIDPGPLSLVDVRALGRSPHPLAVLEAGAALAITTPDGALERQNRAADRDQAKAADRLKAEHDAAVRRYGSPRDDAA
jgi:hypothetical protein